MQTKTLADVPPSSRPRPKVVLELLKPITWFAPMWAFGCGVVSSGEPFYPHWPIVIVGILLAGPLVCGTSQAVNDWFDRHVDAINEPRRPIPSGRIPGRWGIYIACAWTLLSTAVATALGAWGFSAVILGLVLAWAYSAPPFRLKFNGWWGNSAVAACYEGLPWITGAAIMSAGMPANRIFWMASLYSVGAHGIMTLNDFKAVEGDRRMGIRSLPVQLGVERAGQTACAVMIVSQLVVIALLWRWDCPIYAALIAVLTLAQAMLMIRLLKKTRERAPWYNATGTSLYVLGMLITAIALGAMAKV